jgi:hypothetical protein
MGPMVWRVINDFSSGAVCLVLASSVYDEADYIRDHATFMKAALRQDAASLRARHHDV